MRNIDTIKKEIADLNLRIKSLRTDLQKTYKTDLKELCKKYNGKIDSIRVGINNYEFNDGDTPYFSFYYEDMTLVYSDELGNEYEQSSYGAVDNREIENIREEFIELFKAYDVDSFFEELYGEEGEEVEIKV